MLFDSLVLISLHYCYLKVYFGLWLNVVAYSSNPNKLLAYSVLLISLHSAYSPYSAKVPSLKLLINSI